MTRTGAATAFLLCLLLVLAACGGDDDPAAPGNGGDPPGAPTIDWYAAMAPRVWSIHEASLFADPFHPSALYFLTWGGRTLPSAGPGLGLGPERHPARGTHLCLAEGGSLRRRAGPHLRQLGSGSAADRERGVTGSPVGPISSS